MDYYTTSSIKLLSFAQIYTESISPKLKAIDIFLKENTTPFQVYDVSRILEIETDELSYLMERHQMTKIDSMNIFTLILSASSEICQLIGRQFKYGQTNVYTPEMIATIYHLNIHKVRNAFADLNIEFATDMELLEIFKRIHIVTFSS